MMGRTPFEAAENFAAWSRLPRVACSPAPAVVGIPLIVGAVVGTRWRRPARQECVVHFYRNVFSHVPNGKVGDVAGMLKAIHAQEDRAAAGTKSKEIVARLRAMKLKSAAEIVEQRATETFTYYLYHSARWRQIGANNPLERIIRETRRRTRVVGAFPDGHPALMLTAARLRHIASTKWGKRRYLVMDTLLNPAKQEVAA